MARNRVEGVNAAPADKGRAPFLPRTPLRIIPSVMPRRGILWILYMTALCRPSPYLLPQNSTASVTSDPDTNGASAVLWTCQAACVCWHSGTQAVCNEQFRHFKAFVRQGGNAGIQPPLKILPVRGCGPFL